MKNGRIKETLEVLTLPFTVPTIILEEMLSQAIEREIKFQSLEAAISKMLTNCAR